MRKISASLTALLLLCTLMVSSARVAQAQNRDERPPQRQKRAAAGKEAHPVIRQAIRQLQQTKSLLEHKAAHDFAGHRVQAIQSIDQAIAHLQQALQVDKK